MVLSLKSDEKVKHHNFFFNNLLFKPVTFSKLRSFSLKKKKNNNFIPQNCYEK